MKATTDGTLSECEVKFSSGAAACVIMASGGYPEKYASGFEINMPREVRDSVYVAGAKLSDGKLLTAGGRVLGVTATAENLKSAIKNAYNKVDKAEQKKILCIIDALHDCYYACGYENGEIVYPPAYLTEEEVLALQAQGYALCASACLPIAEKTVVNFVDPCQGLEKAAIALAEKGEFKELSALYVRKSSAELNLGK
jgi:hypothetical protein